MKPHICPVKTTRIPPPPPHPHVLHPSTYIASRVMKKLKAGLLQWGHRYEARFMGGGIRQIGSVFDRTVESVHTVIKSRYDSVTTLLAGLPGFDSPQGRISLFSTTSRSALRDHATFCSAHSRVLSLGVKRLGHEANHSHVSIVEVKNAWICTSTSPYVYMAWCLVNPLRPSDTTWFNNQICSLYFRFRMILL
jgi:hypothetical protein